MLASLTAAFVGSTNVALAVDDVDAIDVNPVSVSGCGTQSFTFSGTATYSEPTQHVVVRLDSTELLHDHSEPAAWTTNAVSVNEGSHSVTATIYDHSDHETVRAQDTEVFNISSCSTPTSSSSSSSSDDSDSDDSDEEAVTVQKKKSGQVKSASSATPSAKLKPLNSIFRKVYKRNPTFREWQYWARRLLTDKMEYDALYGAMQWHQLRGRTIGK